jgi:ubiquinone biosynthesis protein UbiJ
MTADIPAGDYAEVEGLAEQIRVLTSQVEALSSRLDARERNAG